MWLYALNPELLKPEIFFFLSKEQLKENLENREKWLKERGDHPKISYLKIAAADVLVYFIPIFSLCIVLPPTF